MSKGLVKTLNIATGTYWDALPAEGELTPRALTSSYTTLGVRLPKTAQQLGPPPFVYPNDSTSRASPDTRNGLTSPSSASEGLEKE